MVVIITLANETFIFDDGNYIYSYREIYNQV